MFQARILIPAPDPENLPDLRARVRAESGAAYSQFCRSLAPDHAKVRRDIFLGYAALALILAVTGAVPGLVPGLLAAAFGAIGIGYAIAYLQLFIHEAAHYNLAPTRPANDRMADRLICWQVGTCIAAYRRTHAQHHRHLGEAGDTEVSYTHALSARFLLEMATGIHALRVFAGRSGGEARERRQAGALKPLLAGAVAHLSIVAGLILVGAWPAALAWIGGMGIFYPLFATLRQLLEHRPAPGQSEEAAVTRLFGDDLFSRSFGGAGFNRHLLHHIEPQISYTRYDALEAYLMRTSVGEALDARRTSYGRAFADLLREGRNG